jgi:SAM-dependent methyltransferase
VLDLLCCPICGEAVAYVDRVLTCKSGHDFAVRDEIPRMVTEAWPDATRIVRETSLAFGSQWNRLAPLASVSIEDLTLHLPPDWTLDTFRGRVLDVGCGMGRYMQLARLQGADVTGVDLSDAVDAARRSWPEARLFQADIGALPFRSDSFDLVYSFGVLHHVPDAGRGLESCFRLVRAGGRLLVWVYADRTGVLRILRQLARSIARRVPLLAPAMIAGAASGLWLYLTLLRLVGKSSGKATFYRRKGFRGIYLDCHDAITAPLESYVSQEDCVAMLARLRASSKGFGRRVDGSGWVIWAVK